MQLLNLLIHYVSALSSDSAGKTTRRVRRGYELALKYTQENNLRNLIVKSCFQNILSSESVSRYFKTSYDLVCFCS